MSYSRAKEIALARIALRSSWSAGDRAAAGEALARLVELARRDGGDDDSDDDDELAAELLRWKIKLGAA